MGHYPYLLCVPSFTSVRWSDYVQLSAEQLDHRYLPDELGVPVPVPTPADLIVAYCRQPCRDDSIGVLFGDNLVRRLSREEFAEKLAESRAHYLTRDDAMPPESAK